MLSSLPLSLFRWFVLSAGLIVSQSFAQDVVTQPPASLHPNSRWIAASWDDLAGAFEDDPREAVAAWLASCARAQPASTSPWRKVCSELSALKNADSEVIRIWLMARLQPFRIEPLAASSAVSNAGLLTGYYEPVLPARREVDSVFRYPLYRLPADLERGGARPWFTRQEIDTAGSQAQQALQGRAIAYLQSPLDVLALQIQGSGQLDLEQADGTHRRIRLAFAGSNNQPYKSVGAWLRDTHGVRELSWPGIKAWAQNNPDQIDRLMWSNPRVVFFKESPASNEGQSSVGPMGAQGVPLTGGRSIAVDPKSIPYGTPVWLSSTGESVKLNRLVIAQDTGSAIVGAVRADYYVGSGDAAGEIAGRLKQSLQMWALWPK